MTRVYLVTITKGSATDPHSWEQQRHVRAESREEAEQQAKEWRDQLDSTAEIDVKLLYAEDV